MLLSATYTGHVLKSEKSARDHGGNRTRDPWFASHPMLALHLDGQQTGFSIILYIPRNTRKKIYIHINLPMPQT